MKAGSLRTIFVLLFIVLQANVVSPTNLNLYWGFTVNDKFRFTMNYQGEFDAIIDQTVYLQAEHLWSIPLYYNQIHLLCLEASDIGVYNQSSNGTYSEMHWASYLIVLSSIHVSDSGGVPKSGVDLFTPLAFPLGNLSHIVDMILETDMILDIYGQSNVTILESWDYWGFEVTGNVFYNSSMRYSNWNVTMQAHIDYSKNDGFLAHYHGLTTLIDSGEIFQEVTLERDGFDWQNMTHFSGGLLVYTQLAQGMYLTVGMTWVAVILFIAFDYRKRRSVNV